MLQTRNVHADSDLGWSRAYFDFGDVTADACREMAFFKLDSLEVREMSVSCTAFTGFSACSVKLVYLGAELDPATGTQVESTSKAQGPVGSITLSAAGFKKLRMNPPTRVMAGSIGFANQREFSPNVQLLKVYVDVTGSGTISKCRVSVLYRINQNLP